MKTSYILLAIIAFVTLTGMVATDVLLKQQYEKIDWRNPYQNFEQRALPAAKHWIVEGTPVSEILIERSKSDAKALVDPDQEKFFRTRQQGDTIRISFTPQYSGYHRQPRDDAYQQLGVQLVLRLPNLQSIRVRNARLTLSGLTSDTLLVSLQNSRLRTDSVRSSDVCSLTIGQNSFAVLSPGDQYKILQTAVQDSSGVQLNGTQADVFAKQILSPKAEVQLRGQALKWLK